MTTIAEIKSVREIALELGNTDDASILDDFITYHERRGEISNGQERFFHSIEKRNSPELIEASKNFLKTLKDPKVKPEIMAVCKYYNQGKYWRQRDIASKILAWYTAEDLKVEEQEAPEVALPSYSDFAYIFENKYALKIRENVCAPHLWNVGDLVQIRKSSSGEVREANSTPYSEDLVGGLRSREGQCRNTNNQDIPYLWDTPCTIIEITDNVGRPMNYNEKRGGTRYYKLLALGRAHVFQAMERDLKKVIKKRIS